MRQILLLSLMLAGCGRQPHGEEDAYDRGEIVRVCVDGTRIVHDPLTGRYVAGKTTWDVSSRFFVERGTLPANVCAQL